MEGKTQSIRNPTKILTDTTNAAELPTDLRRLGHASEATGAYRSAQQATLTPPSPTHPTNSTSTPARSPASAAAAAAVASMAVDPMATATTMASTATAVAMPPAAATAATGQVAGIRYLRAQRRRVIISPPSPPMPDFPSPLRSGRRRYRSRCRRRGKNVHPRIPRRKTPTGSSRTAHGISSIHPLNRPRKTASGGSRNPTARRISRTLCSRYGSHHRRRCRPFQDRRRRHRCARYSRAAVKNNTCHAPRFPILHTASPAAGTPPRQVYLGGSTRERASTSSRDSQAHVRFLLFSDGLHPQQRQP